MSPSRRVLLGGGLALLALLGGCESEDQPATQPTTTSSALSTTTSGPAHAPSASTTSAASASGCPTGVGAGPEDAARAVRCLYAAWKEGDRDKAAAVASVDVVASLFGHRWSPPEADLGPCHPNPRTGGEDCSFDHHSGVYLLDVRRSEGGWRVTQVQGPLTGE